jgi:cell division protein FtsB
MSMVAARMQKMKAGNLTGIGNHNQRKGQNHSNQEIDPDRSHLNYELVNRTEHYQKDIQTFIDEKKISTRAVRSDAVLVNEWIITSDRTFFNGLTEQETKQFFEAAKEYFSEKFGEENIRYATVHLDESTPHMHMGIVPFDNENKLSAKRVFNRQALQGVQEELPNYLQTLRFDIERGQKGSERKNLTVPEFKEMKEEQKRLDSELSYKKEELLVHNKKNKIDPKMDITAFKEKQTVEVKTDEKNIFGQPKMKSVEEWTGNLILSEKDYLKMTTAISHGIEVEERLNNLLETDVYKENQSLTKDVKELSEKKEEVVRLNNKHVDMYRTLEKENTFLKGQISDLKQEIGFLYKTTRDFLKERTGDLKSFKTTFKELVQDISDSLNGNGLKNHFKKEYDNDLNKQNKRNRGMSR